MGGGGMKGKREEEWEVEGLEVEVWVVERCEVKGYEIEKRRQAWQRKLGYGQNESQSLVI